MRLTTFILLIGPVLANQVPFSISKGCLISNSTVEYADSLLKRWNSSGVALAVVRKDGTSEFASCGIATASGTQITPDTLFAIASNSKFFLSISIGLLIHNTTLAVKRGHQLKWTTKLKDLIPEWQLMDEEMTRSATIQDLLSHRTGMPRHDFAQNQRISVPEMISTLRFLRPSASLRETYQYNNLMFSTLSYLPPLLLNQSYASYVKQHIFDPLGMSATTFSVAEAEKSGLMADGFQWDMADVPRGKNGTMKPTKPYFMRPGEEATWAGAGGIISSARDLTLWVSMLLNNGRHPHTNATIVPEAVLDHVQHGRSVSEGGEPQYPEISPRLYASGLERFTYRSHSVIEHSGNNPGFQTMITRLPKDDLGVIVLTNDARGGYFVGESVKWRVIDEAIEADVIDWGARYEDLYAKYMKKAQKTTSRSLNASLPSIPLQDLAMATFHHPAYGALQACLVPTLPSNRTVPSHPHCPSHLFSPHIKRLLSDTQLSSLGPIHGAPDLDSKAIPTLLIPFAHTFSTHLLLSHFDKDVWNVTVVWTNWDTRRKEREKERDLLVRPEESAENDSGIDTDDLVLRWEERFVAEYVPPGEDHADEGWAFGSGFWGQEGPDARSPEGVGREGAEVWFGRVDVE